MIDRPLTPRDLRQFIEDNQIAARLIEDIGPTPTVPAAAEALGVSPNQIVKTLLFLLRRAGEDDEDAVVVIGAGSGHVDKRPLAARFGVGRKRVKLAPADVVLNLLGYPAGGVPPFGHRTRLPVLLDRAVIQAGERFGGLVYAGGGDARTMLEITVDELVRIVQPVVLTMADAAGG